MDRRELKDQIEVCRSQANYWWRREKKDSEPNQREKARLWDVLERAQAAYDQFVEEEIEAGQHWGKSLRSLEQAEKALLEYDAQQARRSSGTKHWTVRVQTAGRTVEMHGLTASKVEEWKLMAQAVGAELEVVEERVG